MEKISKMPIFNWIKGTFLFLCGVTDVYCGSHYSARVCSKKGWYLNLLVRS